MITFEALIKANNFAAAEKVFLKDAEQLLKDGRYKIIRRFVESFPDACRQGRPLFSFYHCISTHLIEPFTTRKIFFELIEIFNEQKSYDRIATIYSNLLINYLYYEECNEKLVVLIQKARQFIEKHETDLARGPFKILNIWIQLGKWWIFLEYDRAFEIAIQAEEIALEYKDEVALIFSRIAMGRMYLEFGKFNKALAQYEKAERVITKSQLHHVYEPFLLKLKANANLYLRAIPEAKKEMEKGIALLDKGSALYYHLILIDLFCCFYNKELDACESVIDKILYDYPDQDSDFRIYVMLFGQLLFAYLSEDKVKTEYYCSRLNRNENSKYYLYDYPNAYLHTAEANLFTGNFSKSLDILDNLINEAPESRFPHALASAYALKGLLYDRLNDKERSSEWFDLMKRTLITNEIEELEIIDISVLKEIADKSNGNAVKNFVKNFYSGQHHPKKMKMPSCKIGANAETASKFHAIKLYAMGNLKIVVDGKRLLPNQLERQKKLLMLLKLIIVFRDRGLPKEVVCDTLWKGYSAESARNNLNMILSRIRKLFGVHHVFISSETDCIRLNKDKYWLDADEFKKKYHQGERHFKLGNFQDALSDFGAAISLYQDDFLAKDLSTESINEARENLKRKQIQSLFKSTKLYLDSEDYQNAHQCADKMISADPYCESCYRLLFIATVFSGKRSALIQLYNKLREKLHTDLAVEPEVQTQELMKRLIQGTIPSRRMWECEVFL
ncbi:MAG: hypothetical protein K9L30_16525 [Desulfobacterales bacterium]|nr:hypothetical protein [Desulfobacterales bacterium]